MPEFVSAYSNGDGGTVVSVSAAFAKNAGLTVLKDEPAVDRHGRPLPPRKATRTSDKKSATAPPTGGSSASKPEEAH